MGNPEKRLAVTGLGFESPAKSHDPLGNTRWCGERKTPSAQECAIFSLRNLG